MAKVAVKDYHVLQILFFRQIVVFLSSVPSIAQSFPKSLKTRHPLTHAFRLMGAFVALSCGIWAVAVLPLTTAITLGFAQVFFIALLALYFLNETVAGIPLLWLWVTPDIGGLLFLLAMGVVATAGQWVGVKALRFGEASVIGNIQYVQLIYATILGFFIFGETPDRYTLAGAAIIIGSSIYLTHREAIRKKSS